MRIEINNQKNTIPFEKIRCGEIFLLSDSYLMKMASIVDEDNNTRNAVDLRTGVTSFVNPTVEYEIVTATLVVSPDNLATTVAVRE